MRPLSILALNVWSGLDYQGYLRVGSLETPTERERRYRWLVEALRPLSPDIIAVNEANPVGPYLRRLARDLGYDCLGHPGLTGVRLGPFRLPVNLLEGDGLLARPELKLAWAGRQQLTGGPVRRNWSWNFRNATQVVGARVRWGGAWLYLLCTHWTIAGGASDYRAQAGCREEPSEASRRSHERGARLRAREAELTLAAARRWVPPGHPALLLGDLNAAPTSPELRALAAAGWTDAFAHLHPGEPGATWDEGGNERIRAHYRRAGGHAERVDYAFLSPGLEPGRLLSAEVVLNASPHPSDHYGLLIKLSRPDARSRTGS